MIYQRNFYYNRLNIVIDDIESSYIVLNTGNIGYKVYVASPYSFNIDDEYKIYIYEHIREDEDTLFGFKTKEKNGVGHGD